jgi:nucleotide-binding universal stress UspA family protein
MLSRVLVAVDGSENSERAIEAALQLAKKTGSKVYVVSVVQPLVLSKYPPKTAIELEELFKQQAQELLAKYTSLAADKHGVKVESILGNGYVPKVIVEKAKENDVDLIVIGSRGLSGIKEMFLGSVSHSVVRGSKVPVLVVK